MATQKRVSQKPVDPKDTASRELKKLAARCEEAEQEVGRLMSTLARTERELAEARGQTSKSMLPAKRASIAPSSGGASLPPRAGATAEAIAEVSASLNAVRDVILSAARDIDAFARKEFAMADARSSKLYDVKARLLRAAGQRQPPTLPAPAPKKSARSSAPPAGARVSLSSALAGGPQRKLSANTIDISELAEYLESLRPAAPEAESDPFASPAEVRMPASPKLPKIR